MIARPANLSHWVALVEAEFRDMPGLHLTKPQVQRFWSLDAVTCDVLLDTLERGRFLRRTPQDAYVRADLGR
jgi:hypothetical protein